MERPNSWEYPGTLADKLDIILPPKLEVITKLKVLSTLDSVYYPLGLASLITVLGKMIYRDACDSGTKWDEELPVCLATCWNAWSEKLPGTIAVPRSITHHRELIQAIDLHGFGDASFNGTSAAIYAVVHQESGVSQGLVAAKSRLAKTGVSLNVSSRGQLFRPYSGSLYF